MPAKLVALDVSSQLGCKTTHGILHGNTIGVSVVNFLLKPISVHHQRHGDISMQPCGYSLGKITAVIFLMMLCVGAVDANISVSPITSALDLDTKRSHLVTVINTGQQPVPVKVSARLWQLNIQGKDVRNATDDLILYPGQFILQPGERRSVRAAPRNIEKPLLEKSYRIIVQEVPVKLDNKTQDSTGVSFLTSYATAFYLTPVSPRSAVNIKAVERQSDGLIFKMINNGNVHSHLRKLNIVFKQNGAEVRIDQVEHLKGLLNENMLAGAERHFTWQWPDQLLPKINLSKSFTVQLEIECEYCGEEKLVLDYKLH